MCIICDRLAAQAANPLFRQHIEAMPTPFERLKQVCAEEWRAFSEHEFVRQLGAGTLPMESFQHYLKQTGSRSTPADTLEQHIAQAPYLIGYAEIGNWLIRQRTTKRMGNPYGTWMDRYTSREFQQAAQAEADWINTRMEDISSERFHELAKIFSEAIRLEAGFWDPEP